MIKKWTAPVYIISIQKIIIYFLLVFLWIYFGYRIESMYSENLFLIYIPFIFLFLFLFSIYPPISQKIDKNAKYILLLFFKKREAEYILFGDRLQIILKENNGEAQNIDFLFNDNNYSFDKVAEMHKLYSSFDFSLMYLSYKKGWFKKIMAIFIPENEFSSIKEKLLDRNKFLTGNDAEKKN